ncbi:MAG: hypothetical protein HN337_02095 [Deltaproteobacteria bacterium]|jgi:hypothetical protein|nr:hypothetical protein [Deltaproteobacteria bacterium]
MKTRITLVCAILFSLGLAVFYLGFFSSCGAIDELAYITMNVLLPEGATQGLAETPVPRTSRFQAIFSRSLDTNERSEVGENFILKQNDTVLPVTVEWASGNSAATFTPESPFAYQTTYTVSLTMTEQEYVEGVPATTFTTAVKGDVNGDGYPDLLVGAAEAVGGGETGKVYLFLNSTDGISNCDLSSCSPSAMITGAAVGNYLGSSVSLAGDVNGDGYADLLIGAEGAGTGEVGQTYIFYGSSEGISDCDMGAGCAADITVSGINAGDFLGGSIAYAGDVNGDGFDDIVMGATAARAAYVINGGASFEAEISAGSSDAVFSGTSGDAGDEDFGNSVASAGDVNGDGYDDVIIGSWKSASDDSGSAYVFFGSSDGLTSCGLGSGCEAGTAIDGAEANDLFGISVGPAGDVDGDGYDDVIIGAINAGGAGNPGQVYVFLGSSSGIDNCDLSATCTADTTITSPIAIQFGFSVHTAGDFNGDGYDDILIGAPQGGNEGVIVGAVMSLFGSANGIPNVDISTTADLDLIYYGSSLSDECGSSVSAVLDFNMDGYGDIIFGASGVDSGGTDKGQVYLYYGSADTNGACTVGNADCMPATTITGAADNDSLNIVR